MRDQPDLPGLSSAALRVLREDQPSQRALTAAYERFGRSPRRRTPGPLVSRWLIAGLVMGLGIAFGADAVVQRLGPPRPAALPAPVAVPRAATRKTGPFLPNRQEVPAPTSEPLLPGTAAPPRAPSATNAKGSAVVGERPPADSAIWAKAAQGLRNNDFAETEAALATLEHSGSTGDREAARLIRAQLMLHQGDQSGARSLLQDLAGNAQSAQVRSKAQSLLEQNATKSNSALNAAPSGT